MGFEIINKIKKEKGLTNAQIAKMSGVTLSTLDKITAGINTNPKLDTLQAICKVLGCRLDDFDDSPSANKNASFCQEDIEHLKKYHDLDFHGKDMVDTVLEKEYTRSIAIKETPPQEETNLIEFPVSPYKASAGSGYLLFDEEPDEIWSVVSNSETRKADIGITVSGDSMEPLYYDSDVLLVRKQPDINIGEIGIFIKDGQGYVKKKGNDRLISINKSRSDIYPSENEEILCFGKVIGKLKPEWVIRK